jgi:leucyl-tRNA synthetase
MGAAFDSYLQMTRDANIGLHRSAFKAYVQTQTLVLAPVCPHWCEDVRSKVLKEATTTLTTPFPEVASPYSTFAASTKLLRDTVSGVREDARENGKDSGSAGVDCSHPFVVTLFFATEYLTWQLECIKLMEEGLGGDEMRVDLELLNMAMKAEGVDVDKARRFAKHLQDLLERGMDRKAVLNKRYPGDQAVVLQAVAETLKQTLPGCMGVRVVEMRDGQSVAGASRPTPGFPTWVFQNSGPA